MKNTSRVFAFSALVLLDLLGGCIGWNETGIWRAERRVNRLVRPGMTRAEAEVGLRAAGATPWDYDPVERAFGGTISDVQSLYIGTADLHAVVFFDAEGRVVRVTTKVDDGAACSVQLQISFRVERPSFQGRMSENCP